MSRSEDKEMIVNYIFESPKNVELALKILAARDEIRRRIIESFVVGLEDCLRKEFGSREDSWEVKNDLKRNVFEHWLRIYVAKKEWKDLYSIALAPEYHSARGFVVGVCSNWEILKARRDEGQIKQAVEAEYRSGKTSDVWPFYVWAEDPYCNWDTEEALRRLYLHEGKEAIDYFKNAFVRIAQAAEKTIDRLVHSDLVREEAE